MKRPCLSALRAAFDRPLVQDAAAALAVSLFVITVFCWAELAAALTLAGRAG